MTPETYARAVELDDDLPLDVCPGCGRDITVISGEQHYTPAGFDALVARTRKKHGRPRVALLNPWLTGFPSKLVDRTELCIWHSDFLSARSHRRQWRLEYEAAKA